MTILVLALSLVLAAQQPGAVQTPTVPPHKTANDYVVGPQDVLKVTVFGVADLTRDVTVDTDGTFDFPLIGRIAAGGQTVRQIEQTIKDKLESRKLLMNPTVNVDVTAYRSQTIYVLGEVRNPTAMTLSANQSILSVLAEAGLLPTAGPEIVISHRRPGTTDGPVLPGEDAKDEIRISRRDIEYGRAQNVRLQDGDTIFVPKAAQFFITGEVRNPGFYPLDRDLTLTQALALAGGATERGAVGRATAERVVDGKTVKVKLKGSDKILPGDNITVPRRLF